jgi:hypothetical protein
MMLMLHYEMAAECARWVALGFVAPAVGWERSKQRRRTYQRLWPWLLLFLAMAAAQLAVTFSHPVPFTELYSSP